VDGGLYGGEREGAHVNDAQGLLDRGLGVEGEAGVNLGGDLAGDDLENLGAELDEEVVEGLVDLGVDVTAGGLGGGDGLVDQGGVLGLLGGGEDEGGVGGGILRLVLANGWRAKVSAGFLLVSC
jgi:hypothetical protein